MSKEEGPETYSLARLQAGERAEFARMIEANSGQIYRLAVKILNNSQDAEDVLQETFLKAFRSIKSFDGRSKFSTWLYRIATNEALMLLRKRRPDTISIEGPDNSSQEEQEPIQIMDWCCLPEEELMSSESRAHLDRAIDTLPNSLRVVFLLRDIEGLSTRETADVLNLSEVAVKTRLSRARLKLREELSAYYAELLERQGYEKK